MDELILSHQSALAFWRSWPSNRAVEYLNDTYSADAICNTPRAFSARDRDVLLERFRIGGLSEDVHFLVQDHTQRRKLKGVRFHSMGTCPSSGAFAAISSKQVNRNGALYDLLCVSPELSFIQMSCVLDFYELVELGYELCGGYSLSAGPEGMESRKVPLTSAANISSIINAAHGMHGVRQARRALQYVVDNSWSPKESQIAAMLVLPRCKGGFGIPKPAMNEEMRVSGKTVQVLQGEKLIPDMYWPEIRTVLEYDSNSKHLDAISIDHDARKRSAYRLLGLDVVTITYGQLSDFDSFAALADDLYSRFGKRRDKTSIEQRAKQHRVHTWYLHGVRETLDC